MQKQAEMYPYFLGLFSSGVFFLFLSTFFLPMIVVAPKKCANLINIGSILIISSFAVLKGPYKFLVTDNLLNKERFFPSWCMLISIIMTLWSSMIIKSYMFTMASLAIEIVCLMNFVCSFFPGGDTGMKYALQALIAMAKQSFSCCFSCFKG